jgi:hypothetical protein
MLHGLLRVAARRRPAATSASRAPSPPLLAGANDLISTKTLLLEHFDDRFTRRTALQSPIAEGKAA